MKFNERLIWFPDELSETSFECESYHLNSSIDISNAEGYGQYVERVSSNPLISQGWTENTRSQRSGRTLELPPSDEIHLTITQCAVNRKSTETFSKKPLDLKDLSTVLWHAMGLVGGEQSPKFTNPSAGASYSCGCYVAVYNVEGANNGIYHFDPVHHYLETVSSSEDAESVRRLVFSEGVADRTGVLLFLTMDLERLLLKYGDRGYRYALIEAGHIGQNICLASAGLGLACTPFGGFFDTEVSRLLQLGMRKNAVYVLAVGSKALPR